MLIGFSPFANLNQKTMFELIKTKPPMFPDPVKHGIKISKEGIDLMKSLLEKDPKDRIGWNNGMVDIIKHEWFKDMDLDKLLNKEYTAPYIPVLSDNKEDVSQFDDEFTNQSLEQTIVSFNHTPENIEKYKEKFKDFDN